MLRLLAAAASPGTAVLGVSHDRAMLDSFCDRVLTMTDGVLATTDRALNAIDPGER